MIVKTYITSTPFNQIRLVEIPDDELSVSQILDQVFKFGQNNFQPQDKPSLSVGDLIVWKRSVYLIEPLGFRNAVTGKWID